ncbi:MAG: anthranilate synthase component I family protein [Saprospiraceae bacterium]|nr:anthranilate synthase component I family protein [Saprospiraceae bacterium]MBP6447763.1 anthranilate synthase component I family protein [Saprospiraceae bacterium]
MLRVKTVSMKLLSDLTTPVSIFLKLREHFPEILLLESSDYSSKEDSQSFICFDPILTLQFENGNFIFTNKLTGETENSYSQNSVEAITRFLSEIECNNDQITERFNGVFGYTGFDMVQEFEGVQFDSSKPNYGIPGLRYDFFRNIIVFDHFYGELFLIENVIDGQEEQLSKVLSIISRQDHQTYPFFLSGVEQKNMEDDDFLNIVKKAKSNCQRGDVFQMVLSRRFSQDFKGDEFNVYRVLRSINPSPYLFYYDYSTFRIFGSSPEAQMVVHEGLAEIHPIAGTFRRTGDDIKDQELAIKLLEDPKENAEHIMLVDLARNDLSKNCHNVKVSNYKEVQFFSHVIHLVSKVRGAINKEVSGYQIFADTFPAGTLSGAPKYRALQLIDEYEPTTRSYYGGGLGLIKLNGDMNHAIIIRSFLSKNNTLHYQSGAGIVIDSIPESELQEVHNKLAALKKALTMGVNL